MPGFGFDIFRYNPLMGGVSVSYLVDDYSPEVAYSLRKISSTATNAIRVRRSSDNAEQDIGFSGNELDAASLTSFVGANSAFITKWYNQGTGGTTYDSVQASSVEQPRIILNGTIDLVNNKPSGFNNYTSVTGLNNTISACSIFMVGKDTASTNYARALSFRNTSDQETASNGFIPLILNSAVNDDTYSNWFQGAFRLNFTMANNTYFLNSSFVNNGALSSYNNGNSNGSYSGAAWSFPLGEIHWGANDGINIWAGYKQELIIFTSDQTANRTAIETEINTYYGIY